MNNDIITLDFYNSSFYIKLDGTEYFSDNLNKFITEIAYPYSSTVKLVSYEPKRNLFVIERENSVTETGIELQEIAWFVNNKAHLLFVISSIQHSQPSSYTLEMERSLRFANTDWMIYRQQEQIMRNVPLSLNATQFESLLNYRQQLRDLTYTYSKDTPANEVVWPTNPIN